MMRVPDTTLVVSAIFQVAATNGTEKVSPGVITATVSQQFGVSMPLHQVVDIMRDLGMVTHTVGNTRYLVWNKNTMEKIKEQYVTRFSTLADQ